MATDYRAAYALPDNLHYLNGATMSPQLRSVTEVGLTAVREKENPTNFTPSRWFPPPTELCRQFAQLINVKSTSVALIPSVSYGMATVAKNINLRAGQRIVSVGEVFPSGYYTWQRLAADSAATLTLVGQPRNAQNPGEAWNTAILEAITENCALVAVRPIHWSNGIVFDLAPIRARCTEVGARLVVDATQWAGARPLDVRALGADAVVAAGYKWLGGGYALGYLYLDERLHNGLPLEENWANRANAADFSKLTTWCDDYLPGAARYNVGERSKFIGVAMASRALQQLLEWGVNTVAEHTDALMAEYWAKFAEAGFALTAPRYRSAHLFGLELPEGVDETRLKAVLAKAQVIVSFRGRYLRVSPHVSSRPQDIEALLTALEQYAKG